MMFRKELCAASPQPCLGVIRSGYERAFKESEDLVAARGPEIQPELLKILHLILHKLITPCGLSEVSNIFCLHPFIVFRFFKRTSYPRHSWYQICLGLQADHKPSPQDLVHLENTQLKEEDLVVLNDVLRENAFVCGTRSACFVNFPKVSYCIFLKSQYKYYIFPIFNVNHW